MSEPTCGSSTEVFLSYLDYKRFCETQGWDFWSFAEFWEQFKVNPNA